MPGLSALVTALNTHWPHNSICKHRPSLQIRSFPPFPYYWYRRSLMRWHVLCPWNWSVTSCHVIAILSSAVVGEKHWKKGRNTSSDSKSPVIWMDISLLAARNCCAQGELLPGRKDIVYGLSGWSGIVACGVYYLWERLPRISNILCVESVGGSVHTCG